MKRPATSDDFLQGGGQVGALMRSHDWSRSPLGSPQSWPRSLQTVVSLLLQSSFPMFVAWGDELGFLYNDAYAEILGSKHPAALGGRFQEIWAEIWPDIRPLVDAALGGATTYREDLPLVMNRRGYDEQAWFTFSYSPVRDDDARVVGMFCAVSETTRRVLAERQLRELNETLERRVVAAVAEHKVLVDVVEGTDAFVQVVDQSYRWLAINRAAADEFERIFGPRPRVGDNMLELLADQPDHLAAVRAVWARALAGEEFVEVAEFGDPQRDRRFYEMRYSVLRDAAGRLIGAYQFVYDVTARVDDQERLQRAQEALRQAQKMESLGQLTGGVAHDFNNLLAVFSNGVQVLERSSVPEQRARVLASMRRAVERGSGLTQQLLSFARRRPVNPQAVDLAACLDEMRELFARAGRGDVQIRTSLMPGLWPVVIDTGEFELAMLNLCVNARDAMPQGGTITIEARNVLEPADDGSPAEFVRLSVRDTGSGMPPDVLARVLEPFFTTKGVGKGSGLGLPLVYGFAQQSGGRLVLESEVGIGTVVTLLLPRSAIEPASATVDAQEPATRAALPPHGQVLLVEDDAEVAALTLEMLTELGFSVLHAATPAAALGALANARAVDFVVSDVMMPGGMNGLELAREMRRRQPRLPIVLTTGYSEALQGMVPGEFKLLMKPYGLDGLYAALAAQRQDTG
ncbi:MAG: PAS domain-containing protein [Vitreoscilla sp.]